MNNDEYIKRELEKVRDEAIDLYNRSGKRVSGQWEKGVEVKSSGANKAALYSYAYLAGRGRTRNGNNGEPTLQQRILIWLRARGIRPIEENMKLSSLAFIIARKIHREGTDKSRHRRVFEEILTPQRIDQIIQNVGRLNVMDFIEQIEVQLNILKNNV